MFDIPFLISGECMQYSFNHLYLLLFYHQVNNIPLQFFYC